MEATRGAYVFYRKEILVPEKSLVQCLRSAIMTRGDIDEVVDRKKAIDKKTGTRSLRGAGKNSQGKRGGSTDYGMIGRPNLVEKIFSRNTTFFGWAYYFQVTSQSTTKVSTF